MDKKAKLLRPNSEMNGNDDELTEPHSVPPYRIICNSEHFIVLNPSQRKTVKENKEDVKDKLDIK